MLNGRKYSTWCGLSFERLCMNEIDRIKDVLKISGMATSHYSLYTDKAQIDMIISRADRVISLCEIKYYDGPFEMSGKDAEDIERKIAVVREKTGRKNIQVVLIASNGIKQNRYSVNMIHRVITLDDIIEA